MVVLDIVFCKIFVSSSRRATFFSHSTDQTHYAVYFTPKSKENPKIRRGYPSLYLLYNDIPFTQNYQHFIS